MRTVYYTATSLDGFIATPDHSLEWLLQFATEPPGDYAKFIASVGAIAMGAHTYEWILRHHPASDASHPQRWPYTQPTWVFTSRHLDTVPGADIRFARGDVRPVHRAMATIAAGRNVWIIGGGDLAGQFHDHGLLDEIIVDVTAVTLGAGAPLLPRAITTPPLRLVSAVPHPPAFVTLTYAVSPPTSGDDSRTSAGL